MRNYCLKWGSKYSADYVNYLSEQVDNLICITEDPTGVNCETIELPSLSTVWWNKMILFNEEFIPGAGVFYDLDLYIKKPVDAFQPDKYMKFLHTDWVDLDQLKLHTMNFKQKYCSINSSILCWDENTQRQEIWDYYIRNKEKIEWTYSGIDTFVEHRFPQKYSLYDDLSVSSFYKNGSHGDVVLFEGLK